MTFSQKFFYQYFVPLKRMFGAVMVQDLNMQPNFFISGGKAFTRNIWLQKTYYLGLGLTVNHWTLTSGVTVLSGRNVLPSDTITNGKL